MRGERLGYRLDTIDGVRNILGIEYCYLIDKDGLIHVFEGGFDECFAVKKSKGTKVISCLKGAL